MHGRVMLAVLTVVVAGGVLVGHAASARFNPIIELLEQKKPVFGVYVPSNRRFGPAASTPAPAPKSPRELATEAVAYHSADYLFDGSMEDQFDSALPPFTDLIRALTQVGIVAKAAPPRMTHPLVIKTPEIAPDPARAQARIAQQLNLGVSGIAFVTVESADEAKQGHAAMRFTSRGGTRPEAVGSAPALWGMDEKAYREKADLWPVNPAGELVAFTIIESKAGLTKVREIAALPEVGVLFPGAGTLRGVFTTTTPTGEKVFDEKGWEGAIQQVLAACKEFRKPCGYPATATDIEMRMQQGFSVFISAWAEPGFKAIETGRRLAGRPVSND